MRTVRNGAIREHPLFKVVRRAANEYLALARDFGMTPASRARLHVEPPREPSELDEFFA